MVKLMPHQEKAVSELHNGSVLRGGVGTGKTITALAYYDKNERPKQLVVITTARKRDELDWQRDAAMFAIGTGDDCADTGQITVDSWNNVTNYTDRKDAFFIFDEQRLVGSGAWVKAFLKIAKNNRWILLSATPGDVWMDFVPVFIANGFYKSRREFTQEHVVWSPYTKFPKVEKYIGIGKLQRLRNKVLVDMPYNRHTKRHVLDMIVGYDKALYDDVVKRRWHPWEDRPIREVAEYFSVLRKIQNSDPTRLEAITKLLNKHPKLIVFYNFDYELELLRELGSYLGVTTAEWNGHKHEPVPNGEEWLYLVQYTAGSEAWNCVSTDAIAFWSLNYSFRILEQSMGRIDRLNTPFNDLYYYLLRCPSPLDSAIRVTLNAKKTFNEVEFHDRLAKNPNLSQNTISENSS